MDALKSFFDTVGGWVWGPPMLILLVGIDEVAAEEEAEEVETEAVAEEAAAEEAAE